MKTGLLTFYHIHHYGAALQAAALVRAVESLGAECETIDYYVNQDNALLRPVSGPSSLAANAHTALHWKELDRRYRCFEDFGKAYFHLTPRRYETAEALRQSPPSYDALICGSDQIWNPLIFPDRRFDPVFFGAFFPGRKIAYAPSFGLSRLPEGMADELRELLKGFSHLSIREEAGQSILREVMKEDRRDIPVTLDPTLLLTAEQWEEFSAVSQTPDVLKTSDASRRASAAFPHNPRGSRNPPALPANHGYLLCYCISSPSVLEPYVRRIAAETGLPVVQLCGVRRKIVPHARLILDAGPAEFLRLFQNASFVLTNSFHGTAFSLQFQKPFFAAVSPAERANPESSRIFALLHPLGLADRIAGGGNTAEIGAAIDWESVSERLSGAREASLSYLKAALYGKADLYGESRETEKDKGNQTDIKEHLPKLACHEDCTGCTACAAVCPKDAISMKRDREGFAFPAVDPARCIHCGRCTAVCPALHPRPVRSPDNPPALFAAWNRDPNIRRESTSGGVFSALAEYVLEGGGAVFGAAMDGQQRVVHTAVFRKEDLWRLRGAKYVQSDLGETFRQVRRSLERGPVLFSGTPCQVDGLYRYLGKRPENLITCDLVCHGVPSPGVWEDWIAFLRTERPAELRSVRFRDKVNGWKDSHMTLSYDNGAVESRPFYDTGYGHAVGRALFLRRSCYRCLYASTDRPADFTLGDFWDLDDLQEQQRWGISLLLVNTPHASYILDQLPLTRKPFPLETALAGNPRLISPTVRPADRDAFFASYAVDSFPRVCQKYLDAPPWLARKVGKALSPELKEKLRRVIFNR